MADKKSIYEGALLDIKKIQEALNANTKEILRSAAREEIDGLVKESLTESDYEEEDAETPETEETPETGGEDEAGAEEAPAEPEAGSEEEPEAAPEFGDNENPDTEFSPSDEVGADQDSGMDADALGGDELDLTAASDDDVIAIYKKLSGEDEIQVVGDEIHLNVSEPGEYVIKKGNETPGAEGGEGAGIEGLGSELGDESGIEDDGEGVDYEIDMDDEPAADGESEIPATDPTDDTPPTEEPQTDEETGYVHEGEETPEVPVVKEEETEEDEVVEESIPVGSAQAHRLPGKADIGQPKGAGADNLKESVKYKKLLSESAELKKENEEFRQALNKFRSMLIETVVFNSNLSYVTKLFMEHATTKEEKKQIILRFDNEVSNLKESKKLYKTIADELTSKKSVNEVVENKITKEVTSSSSKLLNETTAYVDPSTQRIKDLINRVENKNKY